LPERLPSAGEAVNFRSRESPRKRKRRKGIPDTARLKGDHVFETRRRRARGGVQTRAKGRTGQARGERPKSRTLQRGGLTLSVIRSKKRNLISRPKGRKEGTKGEDVEKIATHRRAFDLAQRDVDVAALASSKRPVSGRNKEAVTHAKKWQEKKQGRRFKRESYRMTSSIQGDYAMSRPGRGGKKKKDGTRRKVRRRGRSKKTNYLQR